MKKSVFAILAALILAFTSVTFAAAETAGEASSTSLSGLLDKLLASLAEEGGSEEAGAAADDGEPLAFNYTPWREAIDAYVTEDFGKTFEPGDEQLLTGFLFTKEDGLFSETEVLGRFGLTNYTADGKDLKRKNFVSDVELLTIEKDANGAYKVTAAEHAGEGDAYEANLAAMCEKYGLPLESVRTGLESWEWLDTLNTVQFLDAHPQYERIEFQGELRTLEELEKISDDTIIPGTEELVSSENAETKEGRNILGKLRELVDSIPEEQKKELDQAAVLLISEIAEETGLTEHLGSLFAAEGSQEGIGEEETGNSGFDYDAWRQTIDAYVTEELAKQLESGDERIFFSFSFTKEDGHYNESEILGYYGLANYTADGKDLKLKNYTSQVELVSIEKDENGKYKVTGSEISDDGEGFEKSVSALCGKYGISVESFRSNLQTKEWLDTLSLIMFMNEHPQYERIEYQGELRTLEEINKISDDLMTSLYGGPEEEGAAE